MEELKLSLEAIALLKSLFVADATGAVALKVKLVDKTTYTERALTASNGMEVSNMLNKCLEYDEVTGQTSLILAVDPAEVAALAAP